MRVLKILPVALTLIVTPASAGDMLGGMARGTFGLQATDPAFHGGTGFRSDHSETARKLRALRDEGKALQDADGGKLTKEHRAALQARLDAIIAEANQAQ